jgi:hypothetical protein
MKRPFEHFAAWRLTPPAPAASRRRVRETAPNRGDGMEAHRVDPSPYSKRLSALYPNYFDGWRALFGVPAAVAAPTPSEERERRREVEGGRPDEEASKP